MMARVGTLILVLMAGCAGFAMGPADAGSSTERAQVRSGAASEMSAQTTRRRARRAPARITVTPRPYYYGLPPDAGRECVSWLQEEARPSGTVIVPQLRCRWVRGLGPT
jgi:hypothetical protein